MTLPPRSNVRVLAIDPTTKGFGFVIFEGPGRLIDWGVAYVGRDKKAGALLRVAALLRRYDPDILVIEDHASRACRRRDRVRDLLRSMLHLASAHSIVMHRVSMRAVRAIFSTVGVAMKYEIAAALASRYPELAPFLPRRRKLWMSEDDRMGIFDAAAFAVAYFETMAAPAQNS
jgi:endonuclease/exonuclease/phosphatase family metal-dependent hydrolase